MTDQVVIEPEARLLVELGQERGVLYEDELLGLAQEIDLYCPALLDHGRRSLDSLAARLQGAPVWSFWWP